MSVIDNNTTFKEFRNRCEDKKALANAGDIYVGTGQQNSNVSGVYITEGKNIQTAIAEDVYRTRKISFSVTPNQGNNSSAIGYFANASGVNSTALGYNAIAQGMSTIAIGDRASTSGDYAISIGIGANASLESIAIGDMASAAWGGAVAVGTNAVANGSYSVALGRDSKSMATYSVAIGGANVGSKNEYAIAIGYNASNENDYSLNSIAIGRAAKTGNPSMSAIAIGYNAITSGDYAISIGCSANASLESIAIGDKAYAAWGGSVAVGAATKADGGNAVAIGLGADAPGSTSVAIGSNSSANSKSSVAIGESTSIRGDNSIAIGRAAKTGNPAVNEPRAVDSIAIGNNASADFVGSIAIGPNAFAGWGNYSVAIGYNSFAKTPERPNSKGRTAIGVGANASERAIVIAGNDVIMYVADSGSAWGHDSDERIKENIELGNTSLCLKNINDVPVKRYVYKSFADKYADKHQLGFIAQDLERVYPKLVFTRSVEEFDNPDNPSEKIKIENFKSIEREPLIPVLWGGVQELSKIINEMQNRISQLEKEISEIKA